jgi:streptogramin lyase
MCRLVRLGSAALVISVLACGGGSSDSRGSDTNITSLTTLSETGIETAEGNSADQGDGDPGDGDPGDGDPGDGDADGGPTKWDLGPIPDASFNCSDQGGGDDPASYIWIANSSQSTVSKIDTQTLVEVARYSTRDTPGNPSRTSVSLSGNAAVANRSGGVAKFISNVEECEDNNGQPGIQTSNGANNVLPFGQDDCMDWYTPFGYSTQRPLAWAQGNFNEGSCSYDDEKLWSAGNMGNAEVVLMDGDTGMVEETVIIPNVIGWAGLYGGAVDSDGNFWTVDHNWDGPSTLISVDRDNFTYQTWPVTGDVHYGLAVDSEGRAWLCGSGGFSRFDPDTEQWNHIPPASPGSALGGCMEDANGVIWNSRYPDAVLVGVDTDTMQVVNTINIPAYVHGVSIDFQGNIWGVEFGGSNAYRVNPETLQIDAVGGLVGAYTYSDMTGFALASAAGFPTN